MCITCIVLLFLCVFDSRSFIIDNKLDLENTITANIISQFKEHSLIFHFDEKSKTRIDTIISRTEVYGTIMMANWAVMDIKPLHRPDGYKFIHIILLQSYRQFSRYTRARWFQLENVDILLFMINMDMNPSSGGRQNFTVWAKSFLEHAGGLFILDSLDFTLYNVCFFCGDRSEKLEKINDLSVNGDVIFVPKLENYTNKFDDFNGHVFRVGYTNYKPYFWCDYVREVDENTVLFELMGSEGELLILLHDKLNMTFQMVVFSDAPNLWVHIINAVSNKSIHWAVGGITLTLQRRQVVDFTSHIQTESYTVLYAVYDDPWMSWQNLVQPFQMAVWLCLIFVVLVLTCLFLTAMKTIGKKDDVSFWYLCQACLRFLVEQPLPFIRHSMRSRWSSILLMSLWLMVALILTNAYKSKLMSSLINSRADEPNNIDELVEQGYNFQVSEDDSSVLRENLLTANDTKFLETLKRSSNDVDFCTSVLKTIGQKVAVIDEETNIQFTIQEDCRRLMKVEEQENLRLIRDELFPSQHAWPVQLNAPYRASFDKIIARLHAAGIFSKWNSDYASPAQMVPHSHQHGSGSGAWRCFSLVSMFGPAIIWTLGVITSTLVFVGEIIWGRRLAKRKFRSA